MMTVTESVTKSLVAVRCVTSRLCDVWMAVMQPVSATEAVHCAAAVVYPLVVSELTSRVMVKDAKACFIIEQGQLTLLCAV